MEYDWSLWGIRVEALLEQLYWAGAVVCLETEINGVHTFRWMSDNGFHSPREGGLRLGARRRHRG